MSGFSFRELDPHDRYKLLCGVVVPRPIALDPPLVVLGLQHKADHRRIPRATSTAAGSSSCIWWTKHWQQP
jgi:hypothetical protein